MPSLTTSGSPTFSGGFCTIDSTGSDRVQAPAALLSPTQGWFAMRCKLRWAGSDLSSYRFFSYRDADHDGVEIYHESANQVKMASLAASAETSAIGGGFTQAAETSTTIVGAWTATTLKMSVAGAAFTVNSSRGPVNANSSTDFDIGRYAQSAIQWMQGDVYWAAGGSGTLADADAATIHAFGDTNPTWATLPGTPTFLWYADDATYLDAAPATGFTNSVAPTVTGSLTVGGTVTANAGTWTPTPGSFAYYWHRADDISATNLVEIGATGSTYTLAAADVGKFIRAGVIPSA